MVVMDRPPDVFDAAKLQEIHANQEINTAGVAITHTGNALSEVLMQSSDASLTLTLVKGGTIVSVRLLGEELFDRDAEYQDVTKVTRTKGNPNIFPVFNQMPEGVVLAGARSPLPNHGIARNQTWKAYVHPDFPGVLLLQLRSNAQTREFYPYDFVYTQFLTLARERLSIGQHIETDGAFAVGFHPYFRIHNKRDIEITGIEAGTCYWYLPNALSKAEKDAVIAQDQSLAFVPGQQGSLNFAAGEVNHHFDVAASINTPIALRDPGLQRRIRIERSDAYKGITVWCNAEEENSVCIEPVTDRSGMLSAKPKPWQGSVSYTLEKL
jgi:galactose mutarotase-like enzyme